MQFVALLFLFFVSIPVYAEELNPPDQQESPPVILLEEPKEEPQPEIEETNQDGALLIKSESTSTPKETSCWEDDNQDSWCSFPDGNMTLAISNPFFTQLAIYDQTSNFLSIAASLNGTTIQTNGPNYISLNEPVRLDISYSRSRPNEAYAPYQGIPLIFDEVMQQAGSPSFGRGTGFIFYKGEPGKADLITETYTSYGGSDAAREIIFTEAGHYFLVATPLYYQGKGVPGLDIDQFNYLRFLQFLSTGIAQEGNTPGSGLIDPIAYGILEFDVLDLDRAPKMSNVLFLPGIKGSKLWMGKDGCDFLIFDCNEEILWPPAGHQDTKDLFLDAEGKSLNQVYAKKAETFNSFANIDFYTSLLNTLQSLKESGAMRNYETVPYDWRLSLMDIINNGAEHDGKIFYEEATSTPYIEQELRRLAETSQTGKVTIIAHSNGGLVTKALLAKLGDITTQALVDNIILVGVPQGGAPQAIGALLFGYKEALPFDKCSTWTFLSYICSLLVSRGDARTLAENSPMAYQLLPSFSYFNEVQDPEHPTVRFSGLHAYGQDFAMYGDTIDSWNELSRFLRADDFTRIKPEENDTIHPNVLNSFLLNYAEGVHTHQLDYWLPPIGVRVYQLAGWGVDTISGIDFIEEPTPYLEYLPLYRPMFIEDGDGVVPVPSALMMPTSENVERLWIDLHKIKESTQKERQHGDLLEVSSVIELIKNVLNKIDSLPDFISTGQPPVITESKKLRFILYAQSNFIVQDESGNNTGMQENGNIDISIPDSTYDEFGGTKIITVPQTNNLYTIQIRPTTKAEKVTIDIENVAAGKTVHRSTVTNVPVTPGVNISFTIIGNTGSTTALVEESGTAASTPLISFTNDTTIIYGMSTSTPSVQNFPVPEGNPQQGNTDSTSTSSTLSVPEISNTFVGGGISHHQWSQPAHIVRTSESTKENHVAMKEFSSYTTSIEDRPRAHVPIQTASVYQAFLGVDEWLRELLYTILSFITSLLHIIF